MGGYLKTSKQVVLRDDYSSYYQQATVDVTVSSSGTVNWKITMTNDRVGSSGRGVYLYVKIGDTVVRPAGYIQYNDPNTVQWLSFPTGNGSSASGSFTTTAASLDITIHIACMQSSISYGQKTTETLTRTAWTDIGDGTVFIIDNKNNTFTIGGTKGRSGTNNSSSGPYLSYSFGSASYDKTASNGQRFNVPSASASTTVYAKCLTTAEHGSDTVVTKSSIVYHYAAPALPKNLKLNYSKSRLTVKEPWLFTWSGSEKASNSRYGVKGYRLVLLKNGKSIPIKNNSGTVISSNPYSDDWHTVDVAGPAITIYPLMNDFKAGDTVALGVKPYTYYGDDETKLFNNDYTYSTDAVVQNAGIVNVKVGDTWKEGQVYTKVGSTWKEAESIGVKVGSSWKESQ